MLKAGPVDRSKGLSWMMGELVEQIALRLNHQVARHRVSDEYCHRGYSNGLRGLIEEWTNESGPWCHWRITEPGERDDRISVNYHSSDGDLSLFAHERTTGDSGVILLMAGNSTFWPNILFKIYGDGDIQVKVLRFQRKEVFSEDHRVADFLTIISHPDLRDAIERCVPSADGEEQYVPMDDLEFLREKMSALTYSL